MIVKVSDFGLSTLANNSAATALFSTLAGTPAFLAPEVFQMKPYTFSVDVFSLGLVFLAMIQHTRGDRKLYPRFGEIAMIYLILSKLFWPTTPLGVIDVSFFGYQAVNYVSGYCFYRVYMSNGLGVQCRKQKLLLKEMYAN